MGSKPLVEVRSVQGKTHEETTNQTSDGDSHDPGEDEKANSLPVDSLETAVAQTDSDSSSGDAHGGGNGQLVLGEDEDSDGSAHLHGRATAGGVVGQLVAHN